MLKRVGIPGYVRIQWYKSLADVEVQLKPLTVLFEPNAAGETNFLDALQLLSRTPGLIEPARRRQEAKAKFGRQAARPARGEGQAAAREPPAFVRRWRGATPAGRR